nr:bifunctional nuclease family protein [Ornithinimicrobium cerasi]
MIVLDVLGVRVEMPTNSPIVLLRERDGQRYVPIWIGAPEATAIAYAQQGVEPPRPLTHDLMATVITSLGRTLETVHITSVEENVFYAELHFDQGVVISSRPSDAIALALRTGTSILAPESLLEEVGITMAVEEEDEVERFREFLDQVSAEDFEEPAERQEGSHDEGPPEDGPRTP